MYISRRRVGCDLHFFVKFRSSLQFSTFYSYFLFFLILLLLSSCRLQACSSLLVLRRFARLPLLSHSYAVSADSRDLIKRDAPRFPEFLVTNDFFDSSSIFRLQSSFYSCVTVIQIRWIVVSALMKFENVCCYCRWNESKDGVHLEHSIEL